MKRSILLIVPAVVVLAAIVQLMTAPAAGQYVSSDTYTRYELLRPESHQFKIYYEVTETRAGARFHFNAIREGSEASDESVIDVATGKQLKFEVVTGAQAQADRDGEVSPAAASERFNPTGHYIKVHLAYAVPARGEYRLAIIKTYKDDKSYYADGDAVVFKRSLSIPRNSVVLPPGYRIVASSVAAQVLTEPDGRLKLAFVNAGSGGPLDVSIKLRRLPPGDKKAGGPVVLPPTVPGPAARATSLTERGYQDREILYELEQPQSHSFRITHDYTVRNAGEKYYFNVVRAGSHVTDPESTDLDTGENLKWEILSGKALRRRQLPVEDVKDDTEVVVTYLARPLTAGTTNRIRLKETYTDPKSYYLDGEELVWDRSFGRLRNTVVLPAGWYLSALSMPATIQTLADGRVAVYVVNPRNDDIRVYLRGKQSSTKDTK
ncbi:MAG TPA: hypothetical protein VJH03_11720 [Blastocatellia bacterium]|nr:hypothetical protein [Blastocatellia bacterium]